MGGTPSILSALFFICFFIASTEVEDARAASVPDSTAIRNVDAAMDKEVPRKTSGARMKLKDILFITNRQIDNSAEEKARKDGLVLRIEDVS